MRDAWPICPSVDTQHPKPEPPGWLLVDHRPYEWVQPRGVKLGQIYQRPHDTVINACWFKSLCFKVMCYTAQFVVIDHWYNAQCLLSQSFPPSCRIVYQVFLWEHILLGVGRDYENVDCTPPWVVKGKSWSIYSVMHKTYGYSKNISPLFPLTFSPRRPPPQSRPKGYSFTGAQVVQD